MDINCPHFDFCSGCQRNRQIEQLDVYSEAKEFFLEHDVANVPLRVGSPTGWRCRAKLATRGTADNPQIGLFEEGSHHVVDIPLCQVHHPAINQAIEILRVWISQNKISLYDEQTGLGFLRYLQLAVERKTMRVQLVLVINQRQDVWEKDKGNGLLESLWQNPQACWHSIWLNFNPRKDNVIFSPRWQHVFGEKWLWERFLERDVCFHPASFAQANPEMFEKLLESVKKHIPQTNLIEFYAGVGVIGLVVAERCKTVCCVEIVPLAQTCFEESVKRLPVGLAARLTYICDSAVKQEHLLDGPVQVVLVDPPRKGLDEALLKKLYKPNHLQRLIYISCGWESFKHDCQQLLLNGWKLGHAETFLFFPGSEHLEVLAVFDS